MANAAEWTVLVFINAKNNLEPFAFSNFAQMAAIDDIPEVNVVVEMGRPQRHYTQQFGAWSKTLRFKITKGLEPTEASALQDLGDTDMGNIDNLLAFIEWGRENYPANHTMLVIWNHGQGWRAPRDDEPPGPPQPAQRLTGGYRYVSHDEDTGNKLYNRAIQDGLSGLLADRRPDIIAFDACLMAMVETAYAFRTVSRVMVGSEELEPGDGWDYTRWLKPLVDKRGDVSPEGLGGLVVRAMADQYTDLVPATLSAISLDKLDALATAISQFSTAAIPLLTDTSVDAFRTARNGCMGYAQQYGMHSIDLRHYMEQIVAANLDDGLTQRARDVIAAHDAAILDNYAASTRKGKFGSNGLAIYYPATKNAHDRDPDGGGYEANNSLFPVEFVQQQQWAAFLSAYWQLVP
jgi:hypothetical protein